MKSNKFIVICFVIAIFIAYLSGNSKNKNSHSSYLEIGQLTTLKNGYPIASTEELFHKASDIIISKDVEAYMKLISTGLADRTKEGAEVYYEGKSENNWGIAKVRPKGSTRTYYTNIEAVKGLSH